MSDPAPGILYCHCRYAQVVPAAVKEAVLRGLCASDLPFEAVPDLCELSARADPSLQRLADAPALKIAACYPRAVKWLFANAHAPLSESACEVLNMRVLTEEQVIGALLSTVVSPNLSSSAVPGPTSGSGTGSQSPIA